MRTFHLALLTLALVASSCVTTESGATKDNTAKSPILGESKAFIETPDAPRKISKARWVFKDAKVMTAAGDIFERGYVVVQDGLIQAVGEGDAPTLAGATIIDAKGKTITPGIIDTHSHIGVYANPGVQAHSDGNEATGPVTAHVWAEHSFWPQDPQIWRAVSGGITTIQVLPGSANLIGGRSFTAKLRPKVSAREMRFPGAPQGLKMACGENPKRVYGQKGGPQTRMGNVAGYKRAFQSAVEYKRGWDKYDRDLKKWQDDDGGKDAPTPPGFDLGKDTLKKVLEGKILVHNHCYRADEMSIMLDIADQFGFKIRSFHHALEAYKIADRLAETKTSTSTWTDWWGFKAESLDAVPQNLALLENAGAMAIVHSDSGTEIRHLNQEAAKARTYGQQIGIVIDDNTLLRWLTYNPAWALGIEDKTGTLEKGKMADLVVWSGSPFSVYSLAERVFIDGEEVYNRKNIKMETSDFEEGAHDPRKVLPRKGDK